MDTRFWLELLGYAASAIIAVSLMMSSILRLRLLNSLGALAFSTYGLLIGAYPVAVLNGIIVIVNAFYLIRIFRAKEYFQLLQLPTHSNYLPYFLEFYREEIQRILPGFKYSPAPDRVLLFILRDCSPVGVFIADEKPGGVLHVVLDFVIPRYRNLKIGRFLFVEQADFFRQRGIKEIVIAPRTAQFGAYLLEVGFEAADEKGNSLRFRYLENAG